MKKNNYLTIIIGIILLSVTINGVLAGSNDFNLPLDWILARNGSTVDANLNGIIDLSENSLTLNGQLPTHYLTVNDNNTLKSLINTKLNITNEPYLNVNSSTWWSGLNGFNNGWLYSDVLNKLTWNESQLIANYYNKTQSNSLYYLLTNPVQYVNMSQVVNGVGNWSNDKPSYYTKTETVNGTPSFQVIQFNTTSGTPSTLVNGQCYYTDGADSTYNCVVNSSDGVILQLGEELYLDRPAKNGDNVTISNCAPVYLSGATGNNAIVKLASVDSYRKGQATIGLATQSIAPNGFGRITRFGAVSDCNTINFTEGKQLFLTKTPGVMTDVPPSGNITKVLVGTVIRSNVNNGAISVGIAIIPSLDDLSFVNATLTNNTVLIYNSNTGLWESVNLNNLYYSLGNGDDLASNISLKASPGSCPSGQVVMNTTTNGVQCVTVTGLSGGNLSWNESYANTLYYAISNGDSLATNISNVNASLMNEILVRSQWNKTYADTLYYDKNNGDSLATNISNVQSNLNSAVTNISNVNSSLESTKTQVNNLNTSLTNQINNVQSNVNSVQTNVTNLNTSLTNQVNNVQNNLNSAVTNISNVNSSLVSEISTRSQWNKTYADTLYYAISNGNSLATNISNVNSSLMNEILVRSQWNKTYADTLYYNINNGNSLATNISNLNSSLTNQINGVQSNLNSAVTNISNVNSSLESTKTQVNNLNTSLTNQINNVQSNVNSVQTNVTNLNTSLTNYISNVNNSGNIMQQYASIQKDPQGFPDVTSGAADTHSNITFDDATRNFSIKPVGASFDYYIKGRFVNVTTEKTFIINDTSGFHIIYFDINGNLQEAYALSDTILCDNVIVSAVYWDSIRDIRYMMNDERHSHYMECQTHYYLHEHLGTQYDGGLVPYAVIAGSSSLNSSAYINTSAGAISDEDYTHNIAAFVNSIGAGVFRVYYQKGATGNWSWKQDTIPFTFKGDASGCTGGTKRACYNLNTGGTWTLQQIGGDNRYFLIHFFATNSVTHGTDLVVVMGQTEYTTTALATTGATTEMNSIRTQGVFSTEYKPMYSFIVQTSNQAAFSNTPASIFAAPSTGGQFIDWRTSNLNGASGTSVGGTVTLVGTDSTLTGGPITSSGTLGINNAYIQLFNDTIYVNDVNISLTSQINSVQSNLDSAATNISNVNSSLESTKTQVNNLNTSLTNQISGVQSNVNSVQTNVTNLNNSLTNQINGVQSNVNGVQTNVTNLNTSLTMYVDGVNSSLMNEILVRSQWNKTYADTLYYNINNGNSLATNISNLNSSLTNQINGVQSNLNSAVTNISNVNSSLESTKTQVNNLNNSVPKLSTTNYFTGDNLFTTNGNITLSGTSGQFLVYPKTYFFNDVTLSNITIISVGATGIVIKNIANNTIGIWNDTGGTATLWNNGLLNNTGLIYEQGSNLNSKYNDTISINNLNTSLTNKDSFLQSTSAGWTNTSTQTKTSLLTNISNDLTVSGTSGFGTSNPLFGMHVEKNNGNNWDALFRSNTTNAGLLLGSIDSNTVKIAGIDSTLGAWKDISINGYGGNVAIGTPTASAVLTAYASANTVASFETPAGYSSYVRFRVNSIDKNYIGWYAGSPSGFIISNVTDTNLFVGDNGNVGIGNINPTVKLEVTGGVKATNYTITGSLPRYIWYYNATMWDCLNATGTVYNRGNSSVTC